MARRQEQDARLAQSRVLLAVPDQQPIQNENATAGLQRNLKSTETHRKAVKFRR